MDELVKKWEHRVSWMLTYAEIAHYDGDYDEQEHFEACARQWRNAIVELKEFIEESYNGSTPSC